MKIIKNISYKNTNCICKIENISIYRYMCEVDLLFNYDHPNIIKCLGIEFVDIYKKSYYEQADYNLSTFKIKYSPEKHISMYIKIFQDIANAIKYLHDNKFLHLDIKPANIVIFVKNDHPIAKLIDFGSLCYAPLKYINSNYDLTTYFYGCPEYLTKRNKAIYKYEIKDDVWSYLITILDIFFDININTNILYNNDIITYINDIFNKNISNLDINNDIFIFSKFIYKFYRDITFDDIIKKDIFDIYKNYESKITIKNIKYFIYDDYKWLNNFNDRLLTENILLETYFLMIDILHRSYKSIKEKNKWSDDDIYNIAYNICCNFIEGHQLNIDIIDKINIFLNHCDWCINYDSFFYRISKLSEIIKYKDIILTDKYSELMKSTNKISNIIPTRYSLKITDF